MLGLPGRGFALRVVVRVSPISQCELSLAQINQSTTSRISVLFLAMRRCIQMFLKCLQQEFLEMFCCLLPDQADSVSCAKRVLLHSRLPRFSGRTTCAVSQFAHFLHAPLLGTPLFASPAQHLSVTPDLQPDAHRFHTQHETSSVHPETCVLSPHAKPWVPAWFDEHFVSSEQHGSVPDA